MLLVVGVVVVGVLYLALQIKWPNDFWLHERKLAGILIETAQVGGQRLAVIGIGINLQLPPDTHIEHHAGVTDLMRALEHTPPSRPALLARLLAELQALLDTYALAGFPALRGAWEQRNAFAELPVRISGERDASDGICLGVDENGALLLRTSDGVTRILAGDVSLRPLSGERP